MPSDSGSGAPPRRSFGAEKDGDRQNEYHSGYDEKRSASASGHLGRQEYGINCQLRLSLQLMPTGRFSALFGFTRGMNYFWII